MIGAPLAVWERVLPSFGIRVKGLGVPNPNFQVVSPAGFVRFLEFRRDFVAGNVTDERYEEERTHDDRGHVWGCS